MYGRGTEPLLFWSTTAFFSGSHEVILIPLMSIWPPSTRMLYCGDPLLLIFIHVTSGAAISRLASSFMLRFALKRYSPLPRILKSESSLTFLASCAKVVSHDTSIVLSERLMQLLLVAYANGDVVSGANPTKNTILASINSIIIIVILTVRMKLVRLIFFMRNSVSIEIDR